MRYQQARLDLHVIAPSQAEPNTLLSEEQARARRPSSSSDAVGIALSPAAISRHRDRIAALRGAGHQVWVEVHPATSDPGVASEDVDGALVMFIEPGTKDSADPGQLGKVTELSGRLPVAVDGGITRDLAARCRRHGASYLVSGRGLLTLTVDDPSGVVAPIRERFLRMSQSTITIPPTMRASVLTGERALTVEEVPTPAYASDEVLIEVAAVGVCGSDTHYFRHGRIGDFVVDGPLILGHELSGRIAAVGVGCSRVADRRAGRHRAAEAVPAVPRVPRRTLQPVSEHGVLRDSADRRRLRPLLRDPHRVRAPRPRFDV